MEESGREGPDRDHDERPRGTHAGHEEGRERVDQVLRGGEAQAVCGRPAVAPTPFAASSTIGATTSAPIAVVGSWNRRAKKSFRDWIWPRIRMNTMLRMIAMITLNTAPQAKVFKTVGQGSRPYRGELRIQTR